MLDGEDQCLYIGKRNTRDIQAPEAGANTQIPNKERRDYMVPEAKMAADRMRKGKSAGPARPAGLYSIVQDKANFKDVGGWG